VDEAGVSSDAIWWLGVLLSLAAVALIVWIFKD
jgi:hypothetical protein